MMFCGFVTSGITHTPSLSLQYRLFCSLSINNVCAGVSLICSR